MNQLYETLQNNLVKKLDSERLYLQAYQDGDESDFYRILVENKDRLDPASTGKLSFIRVLDDARAMVKQLQTDWNSRKSLAFGIWLKEKNTYIGDITLKNIDLSIPKAEIGFYIDQKFSDKGYATEALQTLIPFAFEQLSLNKLYGRCTAQNTACCKLFERCGFMLEGLIRQDIWGKDNKALLDLNYFGMTKTDFKQMQQQQQPELTATH